MHRLKDSPLNQANCLERDKTKMCSASCEINSELHIPVTLWLSGLCSQTQLDRQSAIQNGGQGNKQPRWS